jgi:2-keto-4-pentenoate hydratase/2-oxohepta-3-ene-1,7-dioic acid hydratase in catechol pathway
LNKWIDTGMLFKPTSKKASIAKTLRRGTVVMTGTPSGVAAFMDPKAWIKNGDLVEITIEGLGTLRNKHVFV